MIKRYCLGFAFDEKMETVVLIEKAKPDWQKGLLNGVGGKLEENESPIQAMVREFKEETDCTTFSNQWSEVITMYTNYGGHPDKEDWEVYVFTARLYDYDMLDVRTTTEERVVKMKLSDITIYYWIDNIPWLLEMCKNVLNSGLLYGLKR